MIKKRNKKILRNILISLASLLLLAVVLGVLYTWIMGMTQQPPEVPVKDITPKDSKPKVIKHTMPAEDAPVGASIQSMTTPIEPGSNVMLVVKTRPLATCTITAVYNKVASVDSGLSKKTADDFGTVSWTWTVEESVPVGKWPVTVTCSYGKKSGVVIGDLVVKR